METFTFINESSNHIEPYQPLISDFVRIAYALHASEMSDEKKSSLEIEVSEPQRWTEFKDELEDLYYFLAEEQIEVSFSQKKEIISQGRVDEDSQFSVVALFSGGLDSGTYAALLNRTHTRSLLSHTESSLMLYGKARAFRHDYARPWCYIAKTTAQMQVPEVTSNTRALVILGNALAIAGELHIPRVVVPENGPFMLNPPVSTTAKPSHTTDPGMIKKWSGIFNSATDSQVIVEAPFYNKTKAEVVLLLNDPSAVSQTYSCFTSQGQSRMCGICLACVVRRLSCIAADIDERDLYEFNFLSAVGSDFGYQNEQKLPILINAFEFWATLINPSRAMTEEERYRSETLVRHHEVLYRHALDIFLGLKLLLDKSSVELGPVGQTSARLVQSIDRDLLNSRRVELLR